MDVIAQAIGKDYLEKQGAPKYPYIMCRRTDMRKDATYSLHDSAWEGLRVAGKKPDGSPKWEIYHDFNLIIYERGKYAAGTCFIPDTKANRKRLQDMLDNTEFIERKKVKDPVSGEMTEVEIRHKVDPQYVRVSENLLSEKIKEDLYQEFRQRFLEEQKAGEPEEYQEAGQSESQEAEAEVVPARRRGRPAINSLTEPIRRK